MHIPCVRDLYVFTACGSSGHHTEDEDNAHISLTIRYNDLGGQAKVSIRSNIIYMGKT